VVLLSAAIVFLGCAFGPSLMDDVDAAHGQLARNMIDFHDWVIPHLDGVPYMEKAPLPYWLVGASYLLFGVHDWAARLPFALGAVILCWVTARYGSWAFGSRAGFYGGLVLSTSVGLFLFTRILIPDVLLALCICVALWSFQRALNEERDEAHPKVWASVLAASVGTGVMLKGLIALVLPMGGALIYLAVTRQLFSRDTWRRLRPVTGLLIFLGITAPWHVLATLRMPPYFNFSIHPGPGQYHGFFWFYFMNEHVLRFLGLRYPHDYNTVPRISFWFLHVVWLFPWSIYAPLAFKQGYKPVDRASRTRLLALCWSGFLLAFFTFSTTQEYYSMPLYPACALLLGSAIASETKESNVKLATRAVGGLFAVAFSVIAVILYAVRNVPTPGDIAAALSRNPSAYTLSLGHMGDLTLRSFAYLREPLALAGLACLTAAAGAWVLPSRRGILAIVAGMLVFFHASRLALTVFDPYLSSRSLAEQLVREPAGELILNGAYYPFSSLLFYADRNALLLNGRFNNLEYGSYAPGAVPVFIDDAQFSRLWNSAARYYLASDESDTEHVRKLVGELKLVKVAESGGKSLYTNYPLQEKRQSNQENSGQP
jgi:4-amino-4-deoxy-L-arabinose transferase-like glycosyltransferase